MMLMIGHEFIHRIHTSADLLEENWQFGNLRNFEELRSRNPIPGEYSV